MKLLSEYLQLILVIILVKTIPNAAKSITSEACEWSVDVANAKDIQLMIRKIDRKLDLGGSIQIQSLGDSSITVLLSSFQAETANSSDLASNQVSAITREVTITDSLKNPGEFDIKVIRNTNVENRGTSKGNLN